jgi:tetratricopeptide (TPR) repeat protein
MEDVFAIQDEIAEAIVRLSTATLVGSGPKRLTAVQPARDFEAYNLYLKGRFQWNRRTNPAMRTALGNFEEALARDPGYAEAWAGVADCYTLLGWVAFGAMAPSEAFPPAEKAARRALELDPELAEAHKSLGWTRLVYSWDFDGAEKSFRRAIELRPRYAMAHAWYAMHLAWTDRLDEAVEVAARAQELEPLALIIHTLAGWVYYFARRYDDSIEQYRRTLELDPDYLRARLGLGWAYEQVGRLDDAIREFELGARLSSGSPRYSAALAHAYAVAGRRDEALSALAELEELSTWQYVSPSYIAAVHAGLEDADATFAWLERCFKERSGALVYMDVDPQMDTVRDDPRFDDIMRRVGLPGAG